MPPLQSLSLQHSDAYSPDPLVARFGSISSTPLQTPAATLRLGPRPPAPTLRPGPRALGPAIPSAVPSAEVTVHPTWRPPSLPLDIARNNSAADLPTSASYSDHMAVTDEPTPPAAPSVPPSWPSVTSRRRSRGEDASRLHSFHSLSVCELRAELLAERAVTLQELEACVERSDLDALLRAGAARSRRILAAVDAAADAVAEAGVAEAVRAVEAAAAAAAEAEVEAAAEAKAVAEAKAEAEVAAEAAAVAEAAAAAEAEAAAVADAEALAAAMAEVERAAALSEEPMCRADLAREMVALFDQTAEVLLGGTTLAEGGEAGGEAGGEGGEVVAALVEQKEEEDAEQEGEEGEQQQIARLMRELKEAQEAQEAVAAEEGGGDTGSMGSPADALPRVVRARRALALEQSVLPSWESGESLLLLPLQAQPTNFPTHLVHKHAHVQARPTLLLPPQVQLGMSLVLSVVQLSAEERARALGEAEALSVAALHALRASPLLPDARLLGPLRRLLLALEAGGAPAAAHRLCLELHATVRACCLLPCV